jgi:hypothetical protein
VFTEPLSNNGHLFWCHHSDWACMSQYIYCLKIRQFIAYADLKIFLSAYLPCFPFHRIRNVQRGGEDNKWDIYSRVMCLSTLLH